MRLFRLFISILLAICFISCSSDPMEKLISNNALKGAIAPIKVLNYEKQTGKSVDGGLFVQAEILVPFDIKKEQIRATILSALKELKNEEPSCQWFVVYLNPAPFKAERLGTMISVGRGEYKNGEILIDYQVPEEGASMELFSEEQFKSAAAVCVKYYLYYKESQDPHQAYKLTAMDFDIPQTTAKNLRERLIAYYGVTRSTETIK